MYRAIFTLLLLVKTYGSNAQAEPVTSQLPHEVELQGYTRVVFEDHFSFLSLDTAGVPSPNWYNALWYQKLNPANHIRVEDGHLVLLAPPGVIRTSITTVPRRGLGGRTFRYGFFEARMRFAKDDLDWSAFWLFSRDHSLGTDNDHWCEIDIFENFGADLFVGSVHDWTRTTHSRNTNARYRLLHRLDFSDWHSYGLLWTPGKLTWFLDGVPVIKTESPPICEQQDLFMILGSNKHTDGPEHKLEVDWVRVLSR